MLSGNDKQYICNYGKILVPNNKENASFYINTYTFTSEEIAGFSFFPEEGGLNIYDRYMYRVITTYYDIFNRRQLCIFDYTTGNRWEQVVFLVGERVNQTL